MQIPAHHKGFRRYTKPSPSKPCVSPAWLRPYRAILSAGRFVRLLVSGNRFRGSRVCGDEATFFVMTKLVPAQPGTSVRPTAPGRWDAKEKECAVPIAKLDVMASPRPMYLRCPAWSAQDVQDEDNEVHRLMAPVNDSRVPRASRTFPPSSYCNERNSSETLLVSVQSRFGGCCERKERNERGRPGFRGGSSIGVLRARRNRGDGREDGSSRRNVRLTKAQAERSSRAAVPTDVFKAGARRRVGTGEGI